MRYLTANEAWLKTLNEVLIGGSDVSPRNLHSKEIRAHTLMVDMRYPVLTLRERSIGYKFMAAEAAWILSGDNRLATIKPYSRTIHNYVDDEYNDAFFGAYGPPIRDQLGHVVKSLVNDQCTRQAVISIWRPNPPQTKDVPCTLTVQWMIRDGRLHCAVNMRSSDCYLGVPYDIFNFVMLTGMVALLYTQQTGTVLQLGLLYNTAFSRHLYQENFMVARNCLDHNVTEHAIIPRLFDPYQHANADELVSYLWNVAKTGDIERLVK